MALTRRPSYLRALGLVVTSLLVVTMLAQPDARGADHIPSVKLVAVDPVVTVERWGDTVPLDLGTYIVATGGAFDLRVRRQGGGFSVVQVVPDGDDVRTVRRLPATAVTEHSDGLVDFFRIEVRTLDGGRVGSTRASFCPAGYWQERADDSGPALATYPVLSGCYFGQVTKALVWGIDRGWATASPEGWSTQMVLDEGTYDATIRITRAYRDLFDIPARDARATVRLNVVQGEDWDDWPEDPRFEDEEPSGARIAARSPRRPNPFGRTGAPEVQSGASGLPDLAAIPAHNLSTDHIDGRDILAFGATVWNRGPGPLVVEGFRRPGQPVMDAYQYFYSRGVQTGRAPVGTLEYDPRDGHQHWHFTDFARFRLTSTAGTPIVQSGKEAFCLAPTDAVDLTLPTANWRPSWTGLSTSCGGTRSMWIREILDVGWGDTYHQWLPGQSFDITAVPNGTYLVEVTANPDGRLSEAKTGNNRAVRTIKLGGTPGARTVQMR